MDNSEVLTCDDCKQTALDVQEAGLYMDDIHGGKVELKLCDECYEDRCDEMSQGTPERY